MSGICFSGCGVDVVDFTPPEKTFLSALKLVNINMSRDKRKIVMLINNSYSDSYLCLASHGLLILPLDKTYYLLSCFIWFGSCYHLFIISWGTRKVSHSERFKQHCWSRMEKFKILVCFRENWTRTIKSIAISAIRSVSDPRIQPSSLDKNRFKMETSDNYRSTSATEFETRSVCDTYTLGCRHSADMCI